MRTVKRTSLPLLLILLGVFACALPQIPQIDQSAGGTAVAQTVQAIIQQTQGAATGVVIVSSDTPTTVPSSTATLPPTLTLTPTLTFTPTLTPTFTLTPTSTSSATPIVPMISVSVPTNCRVGPGKVYDLVGALLVGEVVQVYARDPSSNFWYIRNPDNPVEFCWVWGEFATVTGLMTGLPIYTPPPSPTPTNTATPSPAFSPSFAGLDMCNSAWWIDIKLQNTGSITFKSVSMTLKDTVTSTTVALVQDGFKDQTGCNSITKSALLSGKTLTASTPQFSYDPTGNKLKLTITLCSDTGLNGMCVTRNMTFTP